MRMPANMAWMVVKLLYNQHSGMNRHMSSINVSIWHIVHVLELHFFGNVCSQGYPSAATLVYIFYVNIMERADYSHSKKICHTHTAGGLYTQASLISWFNVKLSLKMAGQFSSENNSCVKQHSERFISLLSGMVNLYTFLI